MMALGDPAGAAAAPAAAESAVKVVTEAANVANSFLNRDTIKGGTESIMKLHESTSKAVLDFWGKILTVTHVSNPNVDPAGGDVSGDDQSSADLTAIVSLSAWDDWMLQSDAQMGYAVSRGILGAGAYQLELRRHTIDGNLLVQARAQAVKLGECSVELTN